MKMPDNKIQSVIQYFHLKLDSLYIDREVDSFFWILLESELGYTRLDYMKNPDLRLTESQMLTFISFTRRLAKFEPVQYIAGETDFMGNIFKVSPSVLIPRPETEELVNWVTSTFSKTANLKIIDIGTGSGCIAITLKSKFPNANVLGIDIMENALEMAAQNSVLNNADVHFEKRDALHLENQQNQYDVVVSNPPYVLNSEKKEMRENVMNYEPHTALFVADTEPLLFYNAIAKWAIDSLKEKGYLFFEINENFAEETKASLLKIGFTTCQIRNDIFDKPRMIMAQK